MENNHVDESLIEATIRRVAEARAARAAPDEPADGAAASETEAAAQSVTPEDASSSTQPIAEAAPNVEEDAIEATIRRVESARAAREQEAAAAEFEPATEAPLRSVDPPRPSDSSLLTFARRGNAVPAIQPSWEADAVGDRLEHIERIVSETHELVRQLVAGTVYPQPVASAPGPSRAVPVQQDDDWEDEAPSLAPATFGLPQRPIIVDDEPEPAGTAPQAPQPAGQTAEPRRGFDLLPRTYRITVEDKRRGVDLVPLHRALLAMDGVKDMSLLSYNSGVALVALEMVNDIDADLLSRAVSRAMSRPAVVETHNERTLVVKLAEE